MNHSTKTFYRFQGGWLSVFSKFITMIEPGHSQRFTIWEPRSCKGENLLILYGMKAPQEIRTIHELREIPEMEFLEKLKPKIREHKVHGFNEFGGRRR